MHPKVFTGATLALLLIASGAAYAIFGPHLSANEIITPTQGEGKQSSTASTLSGTIVCLPHKGDGPHTMECAIGLKGDNGKYYALTMFSYPDQADVGERVQLIGAMVTTDEFHAKYDIVGTFQVDTITKI